MDINNTSNLLKTQSQSILVQLIFIIITVVKPIGDKVT